MLRFLLFLFLILTTSPVVDCGKLVLVGGDLALDNKPVNEAFVKLASPSYATPYIGVITSGSSWASAETVAKGIVYRLKNVFGVENVEWLPLHVVNGNSCINKSYNDKINSMTGLYINGGDLKLIRDCFFPDGKSTSALSLIRQRYQSNRLAIFASSAGAIALQSTPVLLDRSSWGSLSFGSSCDMNGGFRIFTFGFLDVHFTERGRMGRLIRIAMDHRSYSSKAYGIDQDTAIVINGNSGDVLGSGGVYVVSTSRATLDKEAKFAVKNVEVDYLTDGDSYNFLSGTVYYASDKDLLTSSKQVSSTVGYSRDIFGDQAFEMLATRLVQSRISDSTYGLTKEPTPKWRIDLRKTSATGGAIGRSNGRSLISYKNLYVDIYCVENC